MAIPPSLSSGVLKYHIRKNIIVAISATGEAEAQKLM